jgi:hypothetical protein
MLASGIVDLILADAGGACPEDPRLRRPVAEPGRGYSGAATDDDVTACRALATDHDEGLPDWDWHVPPRIIAHTSTRIEDGKVIERGQALWPIAGTMLPAEFRHAQT